MRTRLRHSVPILIAVGVLVVGIGGVAVAAATIGSDDVINGSLKSEDIKDGTLKSVDIKNGQIQSADVKDGSITATDVKNESLTSGDVKNGTLKTADLSQAAIDALQTTYSGPNWGIVDRNVIGNGDTFLRAGPTIPIATGTGIESPPFGVGSLGIRTGSPDDKAAFGNQVDFLGMNVSELTAVGYSVFTTGENSGLAPNNMPSIAFEIDPNLTLVDSFSTMVYAPDNSTLNRWTTLDAVADPDPRWGLTGMPATTCDINGPRCTWDELMTFLDNGGDEAVILTVQIQKGRDFAFSGAVDGLTINTDVYDFEPFGVFQTTT